MKIINGKTKYLNKNNKKIRPFFNNILLNQLNFEIFKKSPINILSPSKIKKQKILTPDNNSKTNNYLDKINKNKKDNTNNKIFYFKKDNLALNKANNSNIIFKKYLLGNDVILPLKTLNDFENSNIPYYIFNNFNKNISLSPIKKNSRMNINLNSHMFTNTFKNMNSCKKRNNKINKKIFLNISNSNKNFNLYESLNLNNYSNKNLDINHFKTQQNFTKKECESNQIKNNSSNNKFTKRINSFILNKKPNNNKNILKLYNYLNYNNNLSEINKNHEIGDTKNIDDKIKQLIDNPNSFVYIMFNKMKNSKLDEYENQKKFNLKRRFYEYKKDLNKLEQRARYELFNLKKQRVIGNEINMKGKVISTNTFFDLAYGGY